MLTLSQIKYLLAAYGAGGSVKTAELAKSLSVSAPSVCRAADNLICAGLLKREADKSLSLTKKGVEEARRYKACACVISARLENELGLRKAAADNYALRIAAVFDDVCIKKITELNGKEG